MIDPHPFILVKQIVKANCQTDGYGVLYALAEIDPEFSDQVILLATEKDGQPLASGEGPFRIITPNDKKPARWIREVCSIKVAFAKTKCRNNVL